MKELDHQKYDYNFSWLADKIQPTLRALKDKHFDDYQMAGHIQQIINDELYDLWIRWMCEQEVYMSKIKPKDGQSFVLWLQGGCPIEKDD